MLQELRPNSRTDNPMIHGDDEEAARASAQKILDFAETRASTRKKGRVPRSGTGGEKPPTPSQQTGRERARATRKD